MNDASSASLRGRALMVVGTCSNAGKSVLVSALCRIFARRGWRVAPFKSQNMSLNAAVTAQGHEIGRSTYVQAEAAGVEPHVDMNPVLLKPEADCRSQIILQGKVHGHLESKDWGQRKQSFWPEITASLDRLRRRFDLVIIEGAGSPAEINLPDDIANLRVAEYAQAPALLVGDIDRGGVFASLLGTMMLLQPSQRRCVKGFVINKMRGDVALLGEGPEMLRRRAFDLPTLGIVPFLPNLGLAEEDSVVLDGPSPRSVSTSTDDRTAVDNSVDIVVIRLPHMANFDDFDPLAAEPGVRVRFVQQRQALGRPDAVILPGTKTTLADLVWLHTSGLGEAVRRLGEEGAQVVGLCGGYQMLGREVMDPDGIEGDVGACHPGLALLPHRTRFASRKTTRQVDAVCRPTSSMWDALAGLSVRGYELHMGQTLPTSDGVSVEPLFVVSEPGNGPNRGHGDGGQDASGKIWGTYLHGLFDNDAFRHYWLGTLGWQGHGVLLDRQRAYDRWADHVEAHLDIDGVQQILQQSPPFVDAPVEEKRP